MAKYRKKPVVVEVLKYDGLNTSEVKRFCGECCNIEVDDHAYIAGVAPPRIEVTIKTLEGTMRADVGDYIIKGVQGEIYPCKPDIFEKTYEKVEEQPK